MNSRLAQRFIDRRLSAVPAAFLAAAALSFGVSGCQQVPTHEDILFYNRQHELMAAREIAILEQKLAHDEISQETFDVRAKAISDGIQEQAMDSLYRDHMIRTRYAPAPPPR